MAASALTSPAAVVPSEPDHVKSLDGTWRFKLEQPGGYEANSTNGDHPMAGGAFRQPWNRFSSLTIWKARTG